MTQGERVKFLRKELLHLTLDKFSEPLGVQKTAISKIELGTNGLSDAMILSICRVYGCSETWLRDGIEPPFAPQTMNQYIADWVNRVLAEQDESIRKRFIYALSNLSDDGWKTIDQFAQDLINGKK